MASVIKTEQVKQGQGFPKKAVPIINSIIRDLRAVEPKEGKGITMRSFPDGKEINAKAGSGGADNLETVTGAVNGVPSTLNVQTDGNGWTEI